MKNRRDLLKILAASGVALALPEQWVKPVVERGELPAFAQASSLTIYGLVISDLGIINDCQTDDNRPGTIFLGGFFYNDPSGHITYASRLFISTPALSPPDQVFPFLGRALISGDRFSGIIIFGAACVHFGQVDTIPIRVSIQNDIGQMSNTLSGSFDRSVGAAEFGEAEITIVPLSEEHQPLINGLTRQIQQAMKKE